MPYISFNYNITIQNDCLYLEFSTHPYYFSNVIIVFTAKSGLCYDKICH